MMAAFDAFELNDELSFHDHIYAEPFLEGKIPIPDWNRNLSLHPQAMLSKAMCEHGLIYRFE
jgi:hypothetical protein